MRSSLFTLGALGLFHLAGQSALAVDAPTVAWWRMHDRVGNQIPDATGNAHTLTVNGSPTFEGDVVIFDRDGTLETPDSDALDLLGDWTVSFWAREDGRPDENPTNVWINKHVSYADAVGGWSIDSDDQYFQAAIFGSPNCDPQTANLLALGEWYLLTTTFSSTTNTVRIYFNGDLEEEIEPACNHGMGNNSFPVLLGGIFEADMTARPFCRGAMADVRIYDRVLSNAEVGELVALGHGGGSQACMAWQHRSDSGPSVRAHNAMAYDSARGVTVLFGGSTASSIFSDTWEWDGRSWSQRFPATSPPALFLPAMAYDSARSVTVLFGGNNETWEWDGTTWTQRFPASSPSSRTQHAMPYDSARGVTVLFGGQNSGGYLGDTWEWNGTSWTQRSSATSPSARLTHAMAYDGARGVTVLFGGYNNSGGDLDDTWEWNGTNWTELSPATSPPARESHAMVYDSARGASVLFGGNYGGGDLGDTWEWTGTTWTQFSGASPPAREKHQMAFDSVRGVTVLFGGTPDGSTLFGDTWEYGLDSDCDGVLDVNDNCPTDANPDQGDADQDGIADACDGCPNDPGKFTSGQCGCGVADTDTDGDDTADCIDLCPDDPNKIEEGICGCGVADTDTDHDGTADCFDDCPEDANKVAPGVCGCGVADAIGFVGFLPPIGGADATGGSFANPLRAFKLGSTIPVKFMAAQCGSALLSGIHTLRAVKYGSAVDSDPPIDATPTDAATSGNQFRLTDGQWHFNLSTRSGFSQGTWKLIATLSDGSTHEVWVTIKK